VNAAVKVPGCPTVSGDAAVSDRVGMTGRHPGQMKPSFPNRALPSVDAQVIHQGLAGAFTESTTVAFR
jgi:hypothetical protein